MTAPKKQNGVALEVMKEYETRQQKNKVEGCQKKKRYSDEFAARASGVCRMTAEGVRLYIYQCNYCRGWHLTRKEHAPYYAVDYFTREGA